MDPTDQVSKKPASDPSVLSEAKAALLAKWVQKKGPKPALLSIPRIDPAAPAPLSYAQQRLWFLHELDPKNAAYNMVNAYRMRGPLQIPALEQALAAIVRRHSVLRTTFEAGANGPVQVVHPAASVPLPLHDLQDLAPEAQQAARNQHGLEETQEPIDPTTGPVLRARLLRLGAEDHELLVTVHHVAFDEGSELRFQQELAAHYTAAATQKETAPLPEPRIQYADYAAWQRNLPKTGSEAHLNYWKTKLSGLPALDLPTDRPRPAVHGSQGTMHSFRLPATVSQRFRDLCRSENVTVYMGLLAAFQSLLHRYSGQDDLATGSPVSGRTHKDTEDLIGFFVNTLVLRADFTGAPSYREFLSRTRSTCLEAYSHQDVPFEHVVEAVQPERDPSRTPLFQALFSLQNTLDETPKPHGLDMEAQFVVSPTSKFDLSLYMLDDPDGFQGWIEYSTDLFDESTIARMAQHLEQLMKSACASPDAPLAQLALLDEDEQARLLALGTTPALPTPTHTVHEWIAQTAQQHPDKIAIQMAPEAWTYQELDERATVLAATLQAAGVRPGALVGLCSERSPDLVAAVLAVLRCGAAYLPLDPAYPKERLAFMLQDSGASHVLMGTGLDDVLPASDARRVPMPAADSTMQVGNEFAPAAVASEDTAYVLYTSGSTGQPKGTPIHHGALCNLLAAMQNRLEVTPEDTLLSITTLSFDIGTMELLLPLITGATLSLVSRETARDSEALAALVPTATLMQATPATWRMLVDAGWPKVPESHRRLRALSGGEPLAPDLSRAILARAAQLYNGYGPTETTIYSTAHRVRPQDLDAPRIPIGTAVPGTTLTVVDRHGNLTLPGVPGELRIQGHGVATGYLGRPELSAEKFLTAPDGTRTYCTGDLVRWLPDGTLDYLGRIDRQVKIRGFRIEPGEIEVALRSHKQVTNAVVSVHRSQAEPRLVAYVVAKTPDEPELPALLRQHLAAQLPSHMVPAAFVTLPAIPLLPNGKVDTAKLPAPDEDHLARTATHEPAQTATEHALAALWKEVLGVENVGRADDFFALGGHSLLATRLVARIREDQGITLPLRHVFATPKLRDLATAIDQALAIDAGPDEPRPEPLANRTGLPLSPAQERMWFLHQMDPTSAAYNMAFAHQLTGSLDRDALGAAIQAVVTKHEALRTVVLEAEGAPVQVVLDASEAQVDLAFHDLRTLETDPQTERLHAIMDESAAQPFDLQHGPVLRATLLCRADDDHVLLLVLHHFAFDEHSHQVLLNDLGAAYTAARNGEPSMGPAELQYGDFAHWQAHQDPAPKRAALESWSQRLLAARPLDLPTTHAAPATRTFHGAHHHFKLQVPRPQLQAVSASASATPFMTLLAAFQATLHRFSGQIDFAVAAPSSGRPSEHWNNVVGMFVNTLAIPAHLDAAQTFQNHLTNVRATCSEAYAHDVAYAELASHIHAQRPHATGELAHAFFSFEHANTNMDAIPGLHMETWMVPTPTSKFDVSLFVQDTPAGIRASLEYSTDLFDAAWAQRFAASFQHLLDAAITEPNTPVGNLPLQSPAEASSLLAFNPDATPIMAVSAEAAVRNHATQTPNAVAIECEGIPCTYQALNTRVDAIAARIQARGAGPGTMVAVCMPRGFDLVASLLAVHRVGAAYVPLDPDHPASRTALVLADADIQLVLCTTSTRNALPSSCIRLAVDAPETDNDVHIAPRTDLSTDLAYVLHTSGSTGTPKGVMVGHEALRNLLGAFRAQLDVQSTDRLLAVTTISFDIAALELFLPLVSGATIVLATKKQATDPRYLAPLADNANLMQATPATWRMLVDEDWGGNPNLRALCGGEALPMDLAQSLRSRTASLWNVYGPTETTIWSTIHPVTGDEAAMPIGRPLANTRAYILDPQNQLAPVGVRGELCLAGAGVGAGYLERPELTAEKFVEDPFEPGKRMYRTGDLASWAPDGTLLFHGRMDRQLKVRGFRIEPGDIEHALRQEPGVQQAAVVAHSTAGSSARLVAYVAMEPGFDASGLRKALGKRLPQHMVPSTFVTLDELPLTPNKKIDLAALPAPESVDPATAPGYDAKLVAPRTDTEQALAELWQDLLQVSNVTVHDHFFQRGGHSLLATRLASRIRSVLAVEVPLRDLLAALTLEAQAALVDSLHEANDANDASDATGSISFQQQRMLFLHDLDPASAAYNMAVLRRIQGPLDTAVLQQALGEVIHRHPTLRTIFPRNDHGIPTPKLLAEDQIPLQIIKAEDEEDARCILQDAAHEPFDLATGPIVRATLVTLAPEHHILLIGVHHIAFDEWSEDVLLADLRLAYHARIQGAPPRFKNLPRTYAQHAAATRSRLEAGTLDDQLAYWKQQLASLPPLDLPTDHARPAAPTNHGATTPVRIPGTVLDGLRSLCNDTGATLHMGLLAAWQSLLHRYSGQEDFAVGTPIAGRDHEETHNLIGFFVNTLALRADFSDTPSFRTLLAQAKTTALNAYAHQEAPLEHVVEELGIARELDRTPLFQVAFLLQASAQTPSEPGPNELQWSHFHVPAETAKFDLTLALTDGDDAAEMDGFLEYSTDLFAPETAERMATHFTALLAAMVAEPDRAVAHASMLEAAEEAQIESWNQTKRALPEPAVLHTMFSAQAQATPDAPALIQGDAELTYAELDTASTHLAHRIIGLGIRHGDLVGISTRRSLDTTIAVLAVLKAGAAYIPLDPSYPRERLAFMIEDAAPRLVLTHTDLAERLPVDGDRLYLLDGPGSNDPAEAVALPVVAPDDLAYIIYTSGSTGQPKGVLLEHLGAANLAMSHGVLFAPGPGDRVLQFASASFDASVWEWLMALTHGAALVLPSAGTTLAGDDLAHMLQDQHITLATLPPTALATLDTNTDFPRLHTLIVAGEACAPPLVQHWSKGRRFVNAYGPTETSVCVTAHFAEDPPRRVLPIGHPLPNMEAHVLDANGRPVPIGVPGELHAGGAGLARGYHNRPELTADRFIPHPEKPGARLYRTGDLVRRLADGQLEFLGRIDHQVKIRGYRIELGEVESTLLEHPDVSEVIVMAREDVPGDKRLVAYLTGNTDAATCRQHLETRLPGHMVPSAFVVLDALPLTPNGKVDRRALPDPSASALTSSATFVAPRTPREAELAKVWQEVLRVPRVGIHDNFFELGGDSILSIQVVARAQKRGLAITTRALFDHQTVAALAAVAATEKEVQAEQGLVEGTVPLTPIQHWFFARDLPARHHFNQSVLLEVADSVPDTAIEQAIQRILSHHDALRLRFQSGANGWTQDHVSPDAASHDAYARIGLGDHSAAAADAAMLEACQEAQASLDPTTGHNVRAVLFDLGAERPRKLLIAVHHLVVDGVSWRIILEDLETLFADPEAELPPKSTAFRDWATKLVDHATHDEELQAQLPYWTQQTLDTRLPRDSDGENTTDHEQHIHVTLGRDYTEALLRDLPRASGARTEEALLAALATALAEWTGQNQVLVDMEGHGREDILDDVDTNRTVGWFTTTYPLRIDLPGTSNDATLDAVRETLRAVPNRGIGHGLLEYLGPNAARAQLAALAAPEVSFNYLGRFDDAPSDGPPAKLRMLDDAHGDDVAPVGARNRVLELNGAVTHGQLSMRFSYADSIHHEATIQRVADRFQQVLQDMAQTWKARAERQGSNEAARFPLVRAPAAQLQRALAGRTSQVADAYPLTPMQEGMLFHSLREPETGVYVEQSAFHLDGPINLDALEAAWRTLVTRHDILRTAFAWEGLDEVLQLVYHEAPLEVQRLDWSNDSAAALEARLEAFLDEDRIRGFDLAAPPLMRVALIQHAPEQHHMVWTNHHTLLDGWSLPVLLDELGQAYSAHCKDQALELPEPRPFSAFVAHLQNKDPAAAKTYWQNALAGLESPTPLPFEGGSANLATGTKSLLPGEVSTHLDTGTLQALQDLARRTRVTLSTVLQAAWAVVLGRHNDRDDVLFGATVSGRPAELDGVESMVGLFINTLPVRVRLPDNETVPNWLMGLQRQQIEMRDHEHVPLPEIQSWSPLARGQSLFESLLVFENYPWSEGSKQALPIQSVQGLSRTNFPLSLVAAPGDGLGLRLFFDTSRFDDAGIQRLMEHLTHVLEGLAHAPPTATVGDLGILGANESARLAHWGQTTTHVAPACIHDLVHARATADPKAIAVEQAGIKYTYQELQARSNAFAACLRAIGIEHGTVLALALKPSPDAVAAALGTFQAGAAYVPVDPEYPADRIAHMLQDSQAQCIITTSDLADRFTDTGADLILLDDESTWKAPAAFAPVETKPRDLAYIIYTSGSTGKPKGVLVEHQGAAALAAAQQAAFDIQPGTRVLQFASWSFDASVWEMLMALANGATLCLMPQRVAGEALQSFLVQETIHAATLPPTVLRSLEPESLPNLRVVVSAGEELAADLCNAWAHGRSMFNAYGPTESTVCASIKQCQVGDGTPTIGKPFAGARIVLLDTKKRPVPAGVAGELCIGGDCLARGYHDRPELTADRFINDPTQPDDATARLYRTGDLARWNPDGELEFLGRIDHQVKIRGHRIECGEVENALRAHPLVADAFAMALPDPAGGQRLVAYLLGDNVPAAPDLRSFLAQTLPDAMIPSAFVALEALPLTPNGKVDRKALPAPEDIARLGSNHIAPRDPVEQILASIWTRVLGATRVGVHDDFFELGGHSLTATQVVSRIRNALDMEVPLKTLFSARTLEALAHEVRRLRDDGSGLLVPPVTRFDGNDETESAPLSFSQQRLWFLDQWEPGSAVYNIPAFYRLSGILDVRALESALSETIRRHHVLRTTYTTDDEGQPTQLVGPHDRQPLEIIDLTHIPVADREQAAQAIANEESRKPFDLAHGPVYRVKLLRLARDDHWMLLGFHHIAFDGWSMSVLLHEIGVLYEAYHAGTPHSLPDPEVQYGDFARWQRQHLDETALAKQMKHWHKELAHVQSLDLPTDRPRPKVQSFRGSHRWFALPSHLSERLKTFAREEGVTLFMPLLAAFETILHRWSGQEDFAIGTPVAGRTRAETEGLLGFFVNTLVLGADVQGDPSFRELLSRVRDSCLDAYANQDVPFERLVSELHPQRDTSRSPLFQAMFALQDDAMEGNKWGGVRVGGIPVSSNASKFDITMFVADAEERLEGLVEYRSDLFDATTMDRLCNQFQALIEAVLNDPDTPLSGLSLLPAAERELVLHTWNQTSAPYPDAHCIHDLVQEQRHRTPDAPAVLHGDSTWTYAQLDDRAEAIAAHIKASGTQPGDHVAVLLERSTDTPAALLGVLKAGAVYVPIAPSAPRDRIAYILNDAHIKTVLHHAKQEALLGTWPGTRITLDSIPHEAPRVETQGNLPGPQAPAIITYTSGSDGRPKGVVLHHQAISNLAEASKTALGIHPKSRVLQYASAGDDGSILEMIGTLANGASLIIPTPSTTPLGANLHRILAEQEITSVLLPPAVLATLPPDVQLPHLERLLTRGDPLPPALARTWARKVSLANAYGLTEATVIATLAEISADHQGTTPIGRPIANNRAYVLGAHLQPVPVGIAGELCIAGTGLATDYINRPGLANERFVEAPFATGERMHRTGDIARWRPDGQLEYLGRMDDQINIRGHRIDPGEIEAALHEQAEIATAVATIREDEPGNPRLIAYIVHGDGKQRTPEALRAALARTLPDSMIPSAIVPLDAMPLTLHGRVDKTALPAPGASPQTADHHQAPRTELERTLFNIWSKVLKRDHVGIHDNFFDIGGDSILTIRVIALAEQQGIHLEPKQLFEFQNIEELANAIETGTAASNGSIVSFGQRSNNPLFLVHAAAGGAGPFAPLARMLPHHALHAFQAPGIQEGTTPNSSITELAKQYLHDMRTIQPQAPYTLGGWSFGALIAHEMTRILEADGHTVDQLVLLEPTPTFNLASHLKTKVELEDGPIGPEILQLVGLTPDQEPDRADVARRLAVRQAHIQAMLEHEPGTVQAPAILLVTDDTRAQLPTLVSSWYKHLSKAPREATIPGTHDHILEPGFVEDLAETLNAHLTPKEVA